MKTKRFFVIFLAFGMMLSSLPVLAAGDEYDDSQSHPLRITAYLLYPAARVLEWTVFRPFHFLVSGSKGQEYLFGHEPHPPLFAEPQGGYDYGVSKRAPMRETAEPKRTSASEPVAERIAVKEVIIERPVIREVSRIVEVEKVVFQNIAFAFDRADLNDYGKGVAYLAAQKLKEKSGVVIVIEGHTDYVGNEDYNLKLGLRRAETLRQELARLGVDPARMSTTSLGEARPLVTEETDWARAVNRRIEFRIAAP
jgi:outer membrane protein OmpA-like peptidoglycan-associated protein